jgi:uncharacterized membrane protein YeiH
MFTTENITFVLEIIGTVAFALSGVTVALDKKMDLLGIIILGLSPAIGGGIIRDLVLGIHPPKAFQNPVYATVAIAAILIFCLPRVLDFFAKHRKFYDSLMLVSDAIGLGVFTAVGVAAAFHLSEEYSMFLYIFVGVVTGIGGGVLRDTMASVDPYVFVKHFYGTASIIGAVFCVFCWRLLGESTAIMLCTVLVIVLRLLAAKYRWKLPKPQMPDYSTGKLKRKVASQYRKKK